MKRTVAVSIAPDPHIYQSMQNTSITFAEAASEFIDNSLDANAQNVELVVNMKERTFVVSDNGDGCSDLASMLGLGRHRRGRSTRMGRYGVGLKNAAAGLGEQMEIESCQENILRHVLFDFTEPPADWMIDIQEQDSRQLPGTTIWITKLRLTRIGNIERFKEAIGFRFMPALTDGRIINLTNGKEVSRILAWKVPPFEKGDDTYISISETHGSRMFSVTGGLLAHNQRHDRQPFLLIYEHRVLCDSSEACGDFADSPRMLFQVKLEGDWKLLKHKDGLAPEEDWLHERLHEICLPILKRAEQQGEELALAELQSQVELSLNLEIYGRERRRPQNGKGPVDPAKTDRERNNADDVHEEGKARKQNGKPSGGVIFRVVPLGTGPCGNVTKNARRFQIVLNKDHPKIGLLVKQGESEHLKSLAKSLLAAFIATRDRDQQQQLIPGLVDDRDFDTYRNELTRWL
jgi:hypothetical protein